ncbi:Fanconi anemia core complex-associated protein 20 [Seriola lalandi dorsalis]|uniref:Fanconi anemia core complex-associated protein 20 n=1 Tax=Seriola lalandi dorsalis TaxID=1841481 RepID=UPI000C6F9809|nr:Fanconi anemia core complex-associated protein 20 [Seriola lalandi dorsalis]XP_056240318.1 uncharacterized protein si:ch73-70k4.1 [Seriola aureovittata]
MAENYRKSKLKRKKSSVEKLNLEVSSRDTVKTGRLTVFSGDKTADTDGSVVPAAAWWNRQPLAAVESLWAFTLKSALPYLENQHWDLVPDLPHPSTARPTALKPDEQQWCDLKEEVAPFPEPSTLSSPDPVRLSSSEQDLPAKTEPAPPTSDRQLSSHSRQSHDGKTASLQALTKRRRPSLHSWEEAVSSAGCSRARGEEGMKGGEEEEEAGPVNRKHLTDQVKVSDSRVSLQKEGGNKEEVVKDKEEEEVQGSVRGDGRVAGGGERRLQSCPMCLLVFPVGFTQMDCDGHLAQCLSEMNVDMTW